MVKIVVVAPMPMASDRAGGQREDRSAPQQPRRVQQVPPRIVEPRERSRVALRLFRLLDAAERATGGKRASSGVIPRR